MRYRSFVVATALSGLLALGTSCAFGQTWDELTDGGGDAGETLGTAQVTVGNGPLTLITGELFGDADLYRITITDPAVFSATTVGGDIILDSRIFLFDSAGLGVLFNDDTLVGTEFLSTLPIGSLTGPAGTYYIGVSAFDYSPTNAAGDRIFLDFPFDEVHGPDGPGAPGPLDHWEGFSFSEAPYRITLTGASYSADVAAVPEPGALSLLCAVGLGAGVLARRRRR